MLQHVVEHTGANFLPGGTTFGANRLPPDRIRGPARRASGPVPTGALLLPGQGMGTSETAPHP
eukprot:4407855-Pyramimonas_sp.AAC.1